MKKIILLSLLAMIQLFGCSARDRNEGLRYFSYNTSNGMVRGSGESYYIYQDADDSTLVHVDINEDKNNERLLVTDYMGIFDDLQKIIIEKKMYTFKGSYMPKFDVRDGDSWSFSAGYRKGDGIHADGYMAWPKGFREAVDAIGEYFNAWRIMPAKKGKVSAEDAEKFLTSYWSTKAGELVSFRYERHAYGKSKVYTTSRSDSFTSLYFRKMDSNEGTNYNCANPKLLEDLKKVIDEKHLASFPQTPLEKENTRKERWIVEAVFADGSKIEIVDYIPEYDAQDYDRDIERAVETVFDAELESIRKKSPDEIGEYSVTTYDEKGKPSRTINYDGEGRVLNGHDYNNPMLEF